MAWIAFLPSSKLPWCQPEMNETLLADWPVGYLPPCELVCLCNISSHLCCFKVGLSSCYCLAITVSEYFTLGGCCGVEIVYLTLGECASPESKLLLLQSDGSLAFLETDDTCLLILGTLFGHRTFTSPSQVTVAGLSGSWPPPWSPHSTSQDEISCCL